MIVPALLGEASVPAPRTPAEAALLTHQTIIVRPDPDIAQDLS
jgi:hypothetical protein